MVGSTIATLRKRPSTAKGSALFLSISLNRNEGDRADVNAVRIKAETADRIGALRETVWTRSSSTPPSRMRVSRIPPGLGLLPSSLSFFGDGRVQSGSRSEGTRITLSATSSLLKAVHR